MQENNLFKKMINSGDIPINHLRGFREPTEAEHSFIYEKLKKNTKKDIISMCLYSFVCLVFVAFYLYMYFVLDSDKKSFMLIVAGVFILIILMAIYRIVRIDKSINKIVSEKAYQIAPVKISKIILGFGVQIGKSNVKVKDEDGNVYGYEFILNSSLKKIYKKNPEAEFFVIKLDEKRNMYGITYIKTDIEKDTDDVDEINEMISSLNKKSGA